MQFDNNKSIYIQIADHVMDQILNGVYKVEAKIPSVRAMAAELSVNHNTVMRSYDLLQQDDIIYNKRGIGFFVSDQAPYAILQYRKAIFIKESLPQLFNEMHKIGISIKEVDQQYKAYTKTKNP